MAEDLDNVIEQNAAGPKQASADGVSVQQHSLTEQIAADKYLAGKRAMASPGLGIKMAKIVPPGTAEGKCRRRQPHLLSGFVAELSLTCGSFCY